MVVLNVSFDYQAFEVESCRLNGLSFQTVYCLRNINTLASSKYQSNCKYHKASGTMISDIHIQLTRVLCSDRNEI